MKRHVMKTLSQLSAVPFCKPGISSNYVREIQNVYRFTYEWCQVHEKETMFIYIIHYETIDKTILTFTLVRHRIVFKEALINACVTVVAKQ